MSGSCRYASARIGVAVADLYPSLTLLGEVNVSAQSVSSLFETNGLEFSVGPSFRWNILHFGRITNNIEIQESQMRQAIARYQETALNAVREVEDAMVNHRGFLEQWAALSQAMQADQKAVELSLQRYRAGKANFQRVLDAQQQLLNDRQQSFAAQTQAIIQLVRLYKAAGGGWENLVQQAAVCQPCQPAAVVHQPVAVVQQPVSIIQQPVVHQPVVQQPVYQQVVVSPQIVAQPQRYPLAPEFTPTQQTEQFQLSEQFQQTAKSDQTVPEQSIQSILESDVEPLAPQFDTETQPQVSETPKIPPLSESDDAISIESAWDNLKPDQTTPSFETSTTSSDPGSYSLFPSLEATN